MPCMLAAGRGRPVTVPSVGHCVVVRMPQSCAASAPRVTPMTEPAAPLVVRRATAADAEAFARIMGDPEVFPNLMQMPLATEEIWRQRLSVGSDPDSGELRLVAELGGRVVASAGLHPVTRL